MAATAPKKTAETAGESKSAAEMVAEHNAAPTPFVKPAPVAEAVTEKTIDQQLAEIQLEAKKLELEDLRRRVERERSQEDHRKKMWAAQVLSIAEEKAKRDSEQAYCKHKKGGKNMEGILRGNDPNYAVVRNTYPNGDTGVTCSRCCKQWFKPGSAMQKAAQPDDFAAQAADAEVRKQQMAGWVEAMEWPSDNEPSGTQLFMVQVA